MLTGAVIWLPLTAPARTPTDGVPQFALFHSFPHGKLSAPRGGGQAIKAAADKPHLVIAMNTIPRKTGDEYTLRSI
eukprot:COSAG03_NODE_774_length_5906_cov_2.135009_2_plen_76_part_00